MKNAHERFGWLEFTRALKDTTVRVRLRVDGCIAEVAENGRDGQFHLLSVIGGDSDIGAAWAAVQQKQVFKVQGADFAEVELSLGEKAESYRGSLSLPGRRRPVRHLVAVSAAMAQTRLGAAVESNRTLLSDDDPVFVLYRLSERFGLPVVPEWADWFARVEAPQGDDAARRNWLFSCPGFRNQGEVYDLDLARAAARFD